MKTVFLIGFPGCGKTTLGIATARALGCRFTDLDEHIEHCYGTTISQLYRARGEAAFRTIEQRALAEVSQLGGIVSCGGGTPCYGNNMELMNNSGVTVWLTTSEHRLTSRLCLPEHRAVRPQISRLTDDEIATYVHTMLACRTPWYAQAQLQFDSTMIETADETRETACRLAEMLKELT